MKLFTFWRDMDDDDKQRLIWITGAAVAVFAVFTLLSSFSYLFTWRSDQSLRTLAVLDSTAAADNSAGSIGFRWADFLVRRCFGLGSFILVVILFAVAVRLLFGRWHHSMLKTLLVTVSGALLASLLLAFVSTVTGLTNVFGGGLGGECGDTLVQGSIRCFGTFLTGLLLLLLLVGWLFLVSKRFSRWLTALGRGEAGAVEEPAVAKRPHRPVKTAPVAEPETIPASEPEPEPEPDPTPAPEPIPETPPVSAPAGTSGGGAATAWLHSHQNQPVRASGPAPVTSPASAEGTGMQIERGEGLSTEVKKELPRIDNRADLPDYKFPSLELLEEYVSSRQDVSNEELTRNNNKIRMTLENYRIQVNDVKAVVGPTVTLYKVYPAPGVKIADIKRIQEDIGIYLHARGVRVVTLPDSVGIEVANDRPSIVPLRAVLNDDAFRESKAELPVAIGFTIQQKVKVFDLADAPHLLVAGATKQGKSVGLNVIVASLLYSKHPSELKFVFIDPKMVEFSAYERLLRHYLAVLPDAADGDEERSKSIVKTAKDADRILRSLCIEMDERYELLSKAYVQNISQYNEKYKSRHLLPTDGHRFMPYLVTVIDEYADLTMSVGAGGEAKAIARSITTSIIRLAQKGRAAGIHVILATQRPSVDVITGMIKANFPTRIAFRTVSRVDSSTILDAPGAEKLIGRGDMLYYAGVETERVQCALIGNAEIERLTRFVGDQNKYRQCYNTPYYLPAPEGDSTDEEGGMIDMKNLDERFEEAARMVVMTQKGSTSDLQRRLGMGYAKAGRVMDQLEAAGVVGPQEGSKPRAVLIGSLDELEEKLAAFLK